MKVIYPNMSDDYKEGYNAGYGDAAQDYEDSLDDEYDNGYAAGYEAGTTNKDHYVFIVYVVMLMFFGLLIAL